jgi:hypothetical protein
VPVDLLGEVFQQPVLLLALLEDFAIGLDLLLEIVDLLLEKVAERGQRAGGRRGLSRVGSGGRGRGLGLVETSAAAASQFELNFDGEVLAFPVVAALAEKPNQRVRRAGILPGCWMGFR